MYQETVYTLEDLENCLRLFYDEHPLLQRKQTYDQVRDTEHTGAENFLFWLKTGKYKKEENWTYGSF